MMSESTAHSQDQTQACQVERREETIISAAFPLLFHLNLVVLALFRKIVKGASNIL